MFLLLLFFNLANSFNKALLEENPANPEQGSNSSPSDLANPDEEDNKTPSESSDPDQEVNSTPSEPSDPDQSNIITPSGPSDDNQGGSSSDKNQSFSGSLLLIIENLNYLMNDGINKTTFEKYYPDKPDALKSYNDLINMVSNKSFVPLPNYKDTQFSQYFDVEKTLLSIGDLKKTFTENEQLFKEIDPIFKELGPDFLRVLNIDYNTIEKLFDYVLINNKDDIKFGKLFDILGLSKDWVPKVQKILSVIDSKKEISLIFDGLDVTNEYNAFIKKVELLKVPEKDDENFLSLIRVFDAVLSAIEVAHKAYNNCRTTFLNDIFNPLMKEYAVKPLDIFGQSIGNRATSLLNVINKIQSYSNRCANQDEENPDIRCLVYGSVESYLSGLYCRSNEEDEKGEAEETKCNSFDLFKDSVSDFTKPQVNILNLLTEKYKLPEDVVKAIINMATIFTDPSKGIHDVLGFITKIYGEKDPRSEKFDNYTKLFTFLNTIDQSSNFKLIFDYLNISLYYWDYAGNFVKEVSQKKPLCNNSFLEDYYTEDGTCQIEHYINLYTNKMISDEKIASLPDFYKSIINDMVLPLAKTFEMPISNLVNNGYDLLINFLNVTNSANLSSSAFIKRTGEVVNTLIDFVDYVLPYVVKEAPVIKEFYPDGIEKIKGFFDVLKKDESIISLLDSFYDGIGVTFEIISSAAKVLSDDITFKSLIEAVKPTSFLNLNQTAHKLSQIKNMTLHSIAEAITYDGSDSVAKLLASTKTLSINDIAPAKTLILHSDELANSFEKYDLRITTISKALGVSENDLKKLISTLIGPFSSAPYQGVKNVLVHYSGKSENQIKSVLDKIDSLLKSIASGQNIDTNISPSNTDSDATPTPTPSQSAKPIEEEKLPSLPEKEEVEIPPDADSSQTKDIIESQTSNNGAVIPVKGKNVIVENINLGDNNFLQFQDDAAVEYKEGDLNLCLKDDSKSVKINVNNEKIDLSIRNEIKSTVVINVPDNKDITKVEISKNSRISAPLTLIVPENVQSVQIESIDLYGSSSISAEKSDNSEQKVNIAVNTLSAKLGTKATLTNVEIVKAFSLKAESSIKLEEVTFNENAEINVDMTTYINANNKKPLISGKFGAPPHVIKINPPVDDDNIVPDNDKYVLFEFDNDVCKSWEEKVDITALKDINKKECKSDLSSLLRLSDGKDTLVMFKYTNKEDPGKGGNKLGPGPIAGIVVGCVAAVAIIVVVVIIVIRKKKNNNSSNENENNDEAL